jgi:hypothetical protein
MGCAFHKNGGITNTDKTTQAEFLELMTDPGITCKAVAYYMMVGVVMGNVLKIGTTDKQLKRTCYQQAHMYYFFAKEVCVDLAVKDMCTFKGAEATARVAEAAAAGGAAESNAAITEANVETRMLALEALIGDEGVSAAYSFYFCAAP